MTPKSKNANYKIDQLVFFLMERPIGIWMLVSMIDLSIIESEGSPFFFWEY